VAGLLLKWSRPLNPYQAEGITVVGSPPKGLEIVPPEGASHTVAVSDENEAGEIPTRELSLGYWHEKGLILGVYMHYRSRKADKGGSETGRARSQSQGVRV